MYEKQTEEVCLVYKTDDEYFLEKVDAIKVGDFYQINAIPAFAKNIAYGDLIKVELENDELHFEELIKESGHSTIHIVIFDAKEKIVSGLNEFGCGVNTNVAENYIVVDVPPLVSYYGVKAFLDKEKSINTIDYSESCISKLHKLSFS